MRPPQEPSQAVASPASSNQITHTHTGICGAWRRAALEASQGCGSRAVGYKHHSRELQQSQRGLFPGREAHLTETQEARAGASTGTLSPLSRAGSLAARLEEHDYTWLHFHFPTSPVYASVPRWLLYPEGAAEHNALCEAQRGGRHRDAARAGKGVSSLRKHWSCAYLHTRGGTNKMFIC